MSETRSLTVLQIIPSLEAGGAERAVIDIAEALKKAGHRALVISSGGRMVRELEEKGGVHFRWPAASKNPVTILANAARLEGFMSGQGVDIVHARSRAPAWSAWLASRVTRTPFVTTFHAAYKGRSRLKKLYNSVMVKGDRVIAISEFIARHIRQHFPIDEKRLAVIPRGIDFSVFDPAAVTPERREAFRLSARITDDAPVVLIPGRLAPIKGQELALRALARLSRPFVAVIMGPDQGRKDYSEGLRLLARELGLAGKTRFLPGGDMPAALSTADVVLSASLVAEGFGRIPVEAQAMGAPVIATALGATNETIRNGETGWLVPPRDAAALAGALEEALSLDAAARQVWAKRSRAWAMSLSDIRQMCAATLNVYQDLCREKTSP